MRLNELIIDNSHKPIVAKITKSILDSKMVSSIANDPIVYDFVYYTAMYYVVMKTVGGGVSSDSVIKSANKFINKYGTELSTLVTSEVRKLV
jgi:hypothetical protein